MTQWKVVSTAVTFGKYQEEPVQRLIAEGCDVTLNPFGRPFTPEEFMDYAVDADALIVGNDKLPGGIIKQFKKMKIIAKHGVGVDAIDRKTANEMGIIVTNAPGTNKQEVADCAFGFLLLIARDFLTFNDSVKKGQWNKYPGYSFQNKTIGIIGIGNIGLEMVKRAKGFGMNILGYDLVEREEAKKLGVEYGSLEKLICESDYISLHVPLNEGTEEMIGDKQFNAMKDKVILVNTARSKCIKEAALIHALDTGKILGYATDVFDYEPPELKPYYQYHNVYFTPHIAGTTYDSNYRMGSTAVDNVLAVKTGLVPPNLIKENIDDHS